MLAQLGRSNVARTVVAVLLSYDRASCHPDLSVVVTFDLLCHDEGSSKRFIERLERGRCRGQPLEGRWPASDRAG